MGILEWQEISEHVAKILPATVITHKNKCLGTELVDKESDSHLAFFYLRGLYNRDAIFDRNGVVGWPV